MIFVAKSIFAQNTSVYISKIYTPVFSYKLMPTHISYVKAASSISSVHSVVASNFYVSNLGFFCKQEIKLEKITKIPFKFRLGSVESCDRLEGKFKHD
jgi:hypothetical protein